MEGRKPEYWAFGHPSQNNCTKADAVRRAKEVLRECKPIFHNAPFDIEVLAADGVHVRGDYHDTMRLAFINEPRSVDLGLKPQADRFLGMPADEMNMLYDWIVRHIPDAQKKAKRSKGKRIKEWGNYICQAPGGLVGRYAKGDVTRTLGLYEFFVEQLEQCDDEYEDSRMVDSYLREMTLLPTVMDMERRGIRVRLAKLKRELPAYKKAFDHLDKLIRRRLGKRDDFNVGSPTQLANALVEQGLLRDVVYTEKGKVSTKRANLEEFCTDKKLVLMLAMRGTLKTYIGTFMEPWIEVAERNNGYVQPSFNTVRSTDEYGGGRTLGTRTGRFSSSDPNFQNIPSNAADSPHKDTLMALQKLLKGYGVDFVGLRDYFEPDKGCVFIRRDYNQQELRILAHREQGAFLQMYKENPKLDAHDAVRLLVLAVTGVDYPRKHIKQTNFGLIYGMGLYKLALRLGLDIDDARILRDAVLTAIPGVKILMRRMKRLAAEGEPFFTWGGRRYFCEEPIYVPTGDGGKSKRTFDYKMMNTDIQGSAADCTKVGMIQTAQNFRHSRIVLQVHDEIVACCPRGHEKKEMIRMREAMEDVDFSVPMLSDGEVGGVSWARMKKVSW